MFAAFYFKITVVWNMTPYSLIEEYESCNLLSYIRIQHFICLQNCMTPLFKLPYVLCVYRQSQKGMSVFLVYGCFIMSTKYP